MASADRQFCACASSRIATLPVVAEFSKWFAEPFTVLAKGPRPKSRAGRLDLTGDVLTRGLVVGFATAFVMAVSRFV